MPFLPIRHNIANKEWVKLIEQENNLPQGSIIGIKWVKPIEKRSREQRVAHAVFTFNDPTVANSLLRDGAIIDKTKLHPWKEKRDPIRCVKCQTYGHSAKSCTASHDTCATCGQAHRSDDCNNHHHLFCVTCKSKEHTSNDPLCPSLQRKIDETNAKHPENSMPYYPTHETWTHVSLPPTRQPRYSTPAARNHPTPSPYSAHPTTLRQTTLDTQNPTNRPITHGPTGRGHGRNYHHNHNQSRPHPAATSTNSIPIPATITRQQNPTKDPATTQPTSSSEKTATATTTAQRQPLSSDDPTPPTNPSSSWYENNESDPTTRDQL